MYKKRHILLSAIRQQIVIRKKVTDFSCIKKVVLKIRLQNLKILYLKTWK